MVSQRSPPEVVINRPVDDPRQLGSDAVIVDGVAVDVFHPPSPDTRPSIAELLAVVDGFRS